MGLSIGLCYDLKEDYLEAGSAPEDVLEFDSEETVRGLEKAIGELGHSTLRIGRGREFARRLVAGERWDLVLNFAEGVWGRSREAQVPALAELFDQPYTFADPLTCALTLDKAMAKRVVRDHGLQTAPFAVVRDLAVVLAALFGGCLCFLSGPAREKARESHLSLSGDGAGAPGGMMPGAGAMDAATPDDALLTTDGQPQPMDAADDAPNDTSVADHADRTGRRVDDLKKYLATPEGQRRVKHLRAQH